MKRVIRTSHELFNSRAPTTRADSIETNTVAMSIGGAIQTIITIAVIRRCGVPTCRVGYATNDRFDIGTGIRRCVTTGTYHGMYCSISIVGNILVIVTTDTS
jgi:hypothetical protein